MNIASELQERLSVTVLCEPFEINTNTFNYHRAASKRINPDTVPINAIVTADHSLINDSAGARTIVDMVTQQGTPLTRCRAAGFMRCMDLVSSQLPTHNYKKDFQPHSVSTPNMVWFVHSDLTVRCIRVSFEL